MQQALAEAIEKFLFRGTTYTPPSNWYIGLDVSSSGAYAEPTYSGYARVAVARSTSAWTDPTGTGQTSNAATVTFPTVPSSYTGSDVVRRFFIADASTSGNVFDYFDVTPTMPLAASQAPQIGAGAILIQR